MGYILPINQEQYTLYQVRDINGKVNVYQIRQKDRTGKSRLFQEKSYSEITRKGKFIDLRI